MAKISPFRARVEYAAAFTVLDALRALPDRVSMWLGVTIGGLAFHALGSHRRIGMRNLEIAFPDKSEPERRAILKNSFRNLGRVLAVFSKFDDMTEKRVRQLVDYSPDPDWVAASARVRAEGRGHIVIGGHVGNWELGAFTFPFFFEPFTFLARRMDNPFIEIRFHRMRTRHGNIQFDKTNAVTAVVDLLRAGGTVGVLADVNAHHKGGVFVPFFGTPACTHASIAMLAMRTNSVILPMWTVWDESAKRYRVVYEDFIEPVRTGDRERDILNNTVGFVAATERIIRQYPDQWMWIHRRWKTRPEGEEPIY